MTQSATMEEFEALLKDSFETDTPKEGSVVKGKVIAVEAGQAIIDIGYKMEGRIDLKEFESLGETPELVIGQEVEVLIEKESKKSSEYWSGRTEHNSVAVFPKAHYKVGDFVNVKVNDCTTATLIGEAVGYSKNN